MAAAAISIIEIIITLTSFPERRWVVGGGGEGGRRRCSALWVMAANGCAALLDEAAAKIPPRNVAVFSS